MLLQNHARTHAHHTRDTLSDLFSKIHIHIHRLRGLRERISGPGGVTETVPVYEGDEGTRYFVYQCVRYAYNPGANRFEEMEIPLPATHAALLADATGLSPFYLSVFPESMKVIFQKA